MFFLSLSTWTFVLGRGDNYVPSALGTIWVCKLIGTWFGKDLGFGTRGSGIGLHHTVKLRVQHKNLKSRNVLAWFPLLVHQTNVRLTARGRKWCSPPYSMRTESTLLFTPLSVYPNNNECVATAECGVIWQSDILTPCSKIRIRSCSRS